MKHLLIFTAVAAMIFGSASAQEAGKTLPFRPKPYRGNFQQQKQSSQSVSDCPACRAKAGRNYYRRLKEQQNPR